MNPRKAAPLLSVLLLLVVVTAAAAPALQISVYQTTLIRDGDHLAVKEAYSFENPQDSPITPDGGGLLFSLPAKIHGDLAVTVHSDGERREVTLKADPSDPTRQRLAGSLPPGRTSVTISYAISDEGEANFSPRFFYPVQTLRLFVRPETMTVEGTNVHRQQASVMAGFATYGLDPLAAPGTVSLRLSGGETPAAPSAPQSQMNPQEAQEEWHVQIRPNRFSQKETRILLLVMLAVLLGLGLIYSNHLSARLEQSARGIDRRRNELYRLEDRFVTGHLSPEEFTAQRDHIMAKGPGKGSGQGSGKKSGKGKSQHSRKATRKV